MTRERFEWGSPRLRQGHSFFESIYKVEKVERSDWKRKSSLFYFVFELLRIVFWKLVLLISATTLTSGIFTHTPTNVSLTLSVAFWVWTLPLTVMFEVLRRLKDKNDLTHFSPVFHFYTPWKRQETKGSVTYSGGIEMEHWAKMD